MYHSSLVPKVKLKKPQPIVIGSRPLPQPMGANFRSFVTGTKGPAGLGYSTANS